MREERAGLLVSAGRAVLYGRTERLGTRPDTACSVNGLVMLSPCMGSYPEGEEPIVGSPIKSCLLFIRDHALPCSSVVPFNTHRYDVTETLVGHPPAPMELDVSSVQREGEERKVLLDTPNADLLDALSRLVSYEVIIFRLYVGGCWRHNC